MSDTVVVELDETSSCSFPETCDRMLTVQGTTVYATVDEQALPKLHKAREIHNDQKGPHRHEGINSSKETGTNPYERRKIFITAQAPNQQKSDGKKRRSSP